MAANWSKIRSEYINGNISYAKLAKKHKVSLQTVKDRGTKEKWVAQKKEQQTRITQKTNQKTAEKIAEKQSDLAAEINSAAVELLTKIREATQQLDNCIIKEKRKYTRQIKDPETGKMVYVDFEEEKPKILELQHINKGELKQLASALKDIQSIQLLSKEGITTQAPEINITISAATLADVEGDE